VVHRDLLTVKIITELSRVGGQAIHDGDIFIILDCVCPLCPITDQIPIVDMEKRASETDEEPTAEVLFHFAIAFVWGFNDHQTTKGAVSLDGAVFTHKAFKKDTPVAMRKYIADFEGVV
jgi:hypothetical protein